MKKPNKKAIVKRLHREFKRLERGIKSSVKMTITVPIELSWQEGAHTQVIYDDQVLTPKDYAKFDRLKDAKATEYTKRITEYLRKCDTYAILFEEDKYKFWDQVYMGEIKYVKSKT